MLVIAVIKYGYTYICLHTGLVTMLKSLVIKFTKEIIGVEPNEIAQVNHLTILPVSYIF